MKIINKDNIYKEKEKEFFVLKTFKDVIDLGNDKYLTHLSAEEIGKMWDKEELTYYIPTQRGVRYRKVNNKIKEETIVKQSNINEMQSLILKGQLGTTQLTFNVLDNGKGLINYNNSRKLKIACLDDNENILYKFNSASDACRFFNKPIKEAGHIIKVCNKFNKYGKRAKHFGYSWIKL